MLTMLILGDAEAFTHFFPDKYSHVANSPNCRGGDRFLFLDFFTTLGSYAYKKRNMYAFLPRCTN